MENGGLVVGDEVAIEGHAIARKVGDNGGAGLVGACREGEVHDGRDGATLYGEAIKDVAIAIGRHALARYVTLNGDASQSVGAIGEIVEGGLYGAFIVIEADVVGAGCYEAGDTVREVHVIGLEHPAICFERLESLGKGCRVLL